MYDGLVNFRDMGGADSRFGGSFQPGKVFRSGLFSFVGPDSSDDLVETRGVRTIVDLRMDYELAEYPPPPMYTRHRALTAQHLPFFKGHEMAGVTLPRGYEPGPWSTRYTAYTELAGRYVVPRVFETILADGASPTVFHCWSGKDRTGLTAALLLDLLGVEDDVIGADYERSMEWWLPRIGLDELSEGEPPEGYRTVADVIVQTLERLRRQFVTVEEMLLQSGMESDLPDRLRSALLG